MGNIFSLHHIKIGSIILFIILVFSAHADVITNLEAENEEINLDQSNSSSSDKHNHLPCEIVFFMPTQQFENGLMMGFSLAEDINSPLIIKPIVLFGSNSNIGIPLFSNKFDCWIVPNIVQKGKKLQSNEEQDYFFMNHIHENVEIFE